MYTQCPDCSTVFRVTADALRAAQGMVRCGICSTRFNALENLSEQPVPRPSGEDRREDTITVEELPGTEFIELSGSTDRHSDSDSEEEDRDADEATLADADADAFEPETTADTADDDETPPESGEPADSDEFDRIPDTALEFHGSAEDLERLFVAAGSQPEPVDLDLAIGEVSSSDFSGIEVQEEELPWPEQGIDAARGDPGRIASILAFRSPVEDASDLQHDDVPAEAGESESESESEDADVDLDRTDEYPVLDIEQLEAMQSEPAGDRWSGAHDEELPQTRALVAVEPSPEHLPPGATDGQDEEPPPSDAEPTVESEEAPPLLLIPDELRYGSSASAAEELASPSDFEEAESPRRWPAALAAAGLGIVLLAQVVHHWRDDLARHPVAGPWVLGAFGWLGLDVTPPVDLAAFELRQLGAASEPSQAGRIKVRASIVNRAVFAQPYPLLRLTLQDRFGATIGARNLEPAEYLPGGGQDASGLLGPSQRADAEVVFVDPGRDAVGFELDVCIQDKAGLRCGASLPRGAS